MTKSEIIDNIKQEIDRIDDYDDKVDYIAETLATYHERDDFEDILKEIYQYVKKDSDINIDLRMVEFENVLESTNELIMNEKYEEVINLLLPYESYVNELCDISSIDLDKLEVCCFFNEVEKQIYYYLVSDPNKDIHLLESSVSEYYSRLALVYHNSINYNKALECYKKILSFNPCSNQALLGMAYLAYIQDNYLTSLEYLKDFSKYAFSSELIFEGYQLLTNIFIQLGKYSYAGVFAYIGSSFAPNEDLEETMLKIYNQYKNEIDFDLDNEDELDKFLENEEFEYMPNDDVMDVLYTMLLEFKNHEELKEDYLDLASLITSLVDDEELEKELETMLKEYN